MFHGFNTLPAHIQDTLYILTVEMECQDGAHGTAGVIGFCEIVGTLSYIIYALNNRNRDMGNVTGY
jgi:hypothetical protein